MQREHAEFDPQPLLELLVRYELDFVIVGGLAAVAHGSARATFDVDIAFAQDETNVERLAGALRETGAKETLSREPNFTFTTRFGPLDVLGDPAGAPAYRALREAATPVQIRGLTIRVASLDHLIAMSEAGGRPHDKVAAAELRAISDELRAP